MAMETSRRWRAVVRATAIGFLSCLASICTPLFGDTRGEIEVVQLAEISLEPVIALWNQAIQRTRKHDLAGVVSLFCPDCRADWSNLTNSETTFRILRLCFGEKDDVRASHIIAYRDSRGSILAKLYGQRMAMHTVKGTPTVFVSRCCYGILERRTEGDWCIVTPTGHDDRQFGIGASFQNMRIKVLPSQEKIKSWSDLILNVTFENVSKIATVALHPRPSFYLNQNAALVVSSTQRERRKEFAEWYKQIEVRSSPSISGLIEWLNALPRPIQLKPGEKKEFKFNLSEVCWGCKNLDDGPAGAFDLFLIYDSFLEWNPLPVGSPAWKGRVASNVFRITVK